MEDFLKQLGLKLLTYVLFFGLISIAMLGVVTGEFPPHIAAVQEQYQNFQTLRKAANAAAAAQQASARLQAAGQIEKQIPANVLKSQDDIETNSLRQQVGEMRVDQARLSNKLDTLIRQNDAILQLLGARLQPSASAVGSGQPPPPAHR